MRSPSGLSRSTTSSFKSHVSHTILLSDIHAAVKAHSSKPLEETEPNLGGGGGDKFVKMLSIFFLFFVLLTFE